MWKKGGKWFKENELIEKWIELQGAGVGGQRSKKKLLENCKFAYTLKI